MKVHEQYMRHSSLHNLLGAVMLVIALSLSLPSCTKSVPVEGAVIEGKVTGFDKDDLIQAVLMRFDGQTGKGIVIDTIRNGHFAFRLDSLGEAKRYSVSFFRPHGKYADVLSHGPEIYLEKGVLVRIEGEGRYIYNAKIESPVKDQKLRQSFVRTGKPGRTSTPIGTLQSMSCSMERMSLKKRVIP